MLGQQEVTINNNKLTPPYKSQEMSKQGKYMLQ